MLSKALVFVFTFLGVFGLFMATMPPEFLTIYNPGYMTVQVKEKFSMADVTMYDSSIMDNMTYQYTSLEDGPDPPDWEFGLPSGQYLEVWWSEYYFIKCIQFRHDTKVWYGYDTHILTNYKKDGVTMVAGQNSYRLTKTELEDNWYDVVNGSIFVSKCEHITTSMIIGPTNVSKTIGEAWDEGKLSYWASYEINWNATGVSAWTIVGQLLTFQAPDLGVPGVGGIILNAVIAIPTWSLIAYLVYKIVTGIIPFLSGGGGD